MKIEFHDKNIIEDKNLLYSIIVSKYKGKWVFVKDRERQRWEVPAGTREKGEEIIETANRELYEETGAIKYKLNYICDYSLELNNVITHASLFFAEIEELETLPEYEIEEIRFQEDPPIDLIKNEIQFTLFNKVKEILQGEENVLDVT